MEKLINEKESNFPQSSLNEKNAFYLPQNQQNLINSNGDGHANPQSTYNSNFSNNLNTQQSNYHYNIDCTKSNAPSNSYCESSSTYSEKNKKKTKNDNSSTSYSTSYSNLFTSLLDSLANDKSDTDKIKALILLEKDVMLIKDKNK
jgi:hypothetical protein